jgi:SAM-dependent methyltransferase
MTNFHPTFSDRLRARSICKRVPGYSSPHHYAAFRHLLAARQIETLLIVGVYFGRDICFILDAARRLKRPVVVTGCDKFSDDACNDWPEEKRGLNWHQAGFGAAPSLEVAQANVAKYGQATLIKARDEEFLAACPDRFDAIYLDASHDYESVKRQIAQSRRLLNPGGFLFGDDYSDEGTWGVKRAVTEFAPDHELMFGWLWLATPH